MQSGCAELTDREQVGALSDAQGLAINRQFRTQEAEIPAAIAVAGAESKNPQVREELVSESDAVI